MQKIYYICMKLSDIDQINIDPIADFPQERGQADNHIKEAKPLHNSNKKIRKNNFQGESKIRHWNRDEKKKYHWFLEVYHKYFELSHLKRFVKIFTLMEKFLGTREAKQCRSHHQKMEKKYGNFCNILLNLRKENYGTEDPDLIRKDLLKHNIKIIHRICEAQQLHEAEKNQDKQLNKKEKKVSKKQQQGNAEGQNMEANFLNYPDLEQLFK